MVHHSASPLTTTAADVALWHTTDRGFDGPGYHLIVEATGEIQHGRDIRKVGAHCKGVGNSHGIGICLVGDNTSETDDWTRAQIKTLLLLHFVLSALFPGAVWLGHRDMPGAATLCPGIDIRGLLQLPPLESATVQT